MEYKTIAYDGKAETEIKKSRFICQLKRVETETEARGFIQAVKKEHYKATHNCSAFVLGQEGQIKRTNDDGEPSGTAGLPMLGVLENLELTNTVAVVTRYFGGIKLGTGGLIRAYANSVAHAVQSIGRVQIKDQQAICLRLSYAQYQELANFLKNHQLTEVHPKFAAQVSTTIFVNQERVEQTIDELTEFFHGKAKLTLGPIQEIQIPII